MISVVAKLLSTHSYRVYIVKALPDALKLMWFTVLKDYDPIVKASSRPTS